MATLKINCVSGSVEGVITAAKTVEANKTYRSPLKQFFEVHNPMNPKRIWITGI